MKNMLKIEPDFDENGKIIDFLTGVLKQDKPEERVRQKYLKILHFEYNYPKEVIATEVSVYYGRNILRDDGGNPIRMDIAVYQDSIDCANRDQGRIWFVVETKAPTKEGGYNQLVSYIFNTSANGGVWYNQDNINFFRRFDAPETKLEDWIGIPRYNESWDAVGRRRKTELREPSDIKGLFRLCHNTLYKYGTEEDDLTMDMVRIILAKWRDEEKPGDWPEFYCMPGDMSSIEGINRVADRVQKLFAEVRDASLDVFEAHEKILIENHHIAELVCILQEYKLIADDESRWDVMGTAYEEYTITALRRKRGQFLTNRLIVELLVKMLNPTPDDIMLDPAGGVGGFCLATLKYMREEIRKSHQPEGVKRRLFEKVKGAIFMIDITKRLVKIAKTVMILSGDGHEGFVSGDSLGHIENLDHKLLDKISPGIPTIVLTNPPFAGLTNGRITNSDVLAQFELGKRWIWSNDHYLPTSEIDASGTPPEILFLERCLQWCAPGGKIGIVVPKGLLDTDTGLAARHYIFKNVKILAVINCHKNTFQPHTGSRTALLVLEKKETPTHEEDDYKIFMAISRKIGQDSEGEPTYKKDDAGNVLNELDHDLDQILESYKDIINNNFIASEFIYYIMRSQIDNRTLKINPQAYLPKLNEAIEKVIEKGEQEGWTTTTIGQIAKRVFKGARFRRQDLEVDSKTGDDIVAFYTPAALLQDRGDSVKFLDLSKAEPNRRKIIESFRAKKGELLITRSGSIGRVVYVTDQLDGELISDDLIHVVIEDEKLRGYVYMFLKTDLAQKQLIRNEYGTIQQHIEPIHVREIIVPLLEDESILDSIGQTIINSIKAKEESINLEKTALKSFDELF